MENICSILVFFYLFIASKGSIILIGVEVNRTSEWDFSKNVLKVKHLALGNFFGRLLDKD